MPRATHKHQAPKLLAAKNKRHAAHAPAARTGFFQRHLVPIAIGSCLAVVVFVFGAAGVILLDHKTTTSRVVVATKFDGISEEYVTYESKDSYGLVVYPNTNTASDITAKSVANSLYQECRRRKTELCEVTLEVFEAQPYIQLIYTVLSRNKNGSEQRQKHGLVINRESGRRLNLGDFFEPNTQLPTNTEPQINAQLSSFVIRGESFQLLLNDTEQARTAGLPLDTLYRSFSTVAEPVFPELYAKKLAEEQAIAAAKKAVEEAELARQATRALVNNDRSNVDCAVMKCLALTYDDGPSGQYGNIILDVLEQRQAVATFFVLGSEVVKRPNILQRAVTSKNEIGNHSWIHPIFTKHSRARIRSEIDQTNLAIFNAIGSYPNFFRPPSGAYNNRVVSEVGMPFGMWSHDTMDWKDRDAETVYQRALAGAKPGGVILMHEIHGPTIEAAPRIIDELQRQGYVLVTMSELFGITKDNIGQFNGKVWRSR